MIVGIAVAVLVALGGGALWAVYYFTDVFDDAPAPKKPAQKPAQKPQPKPAPHK
jgi:hypothetical protein